MKNEILLWLAPVVLNETQKSKQIPSHA